jgi:exodeoxyribonuclease V alpha subunit
MPLAAVDEPAPQRDEIALVGTVEGKHWQSPDGRFAVLTVRREHGDELVSVVGEVAELSPGETVRFDGRFEEHPVYGRRFRALAWRRELPHSTQGLIRFLGSGRIPGVGKALAERLVARFGDRTLDVITAQTERLREVPGIGKKKAAAIAEAVRAQRSEAETLAFLHGLGLGPALAKKVVSKYGSRAAQQLREDPYRVAQEISGIGFATADRIGRQLGITEDDPRRAAGAVLHLLARAADQGHVYLPAEELTDQAIELGVPASRIAPAIADLAARSMLVIDGTDVYAPPLHRAECEVARMISQRAHERPTPKKLNEAIRAIEREGLSDEQFTAVRAALTSRLLVLTGGPGTGKTTTVRAIVKAHEVLGHRVVLCAPTGRAAKRLSEASGRDARTIHRLLEWNPALGAFQRGALAPIEADVVLVDEASMLDLQLAACLLTAMPPECTLVLVGDVDQLPPVGAGPVLRELIASGICPIVRLHRVFRQAQASAIVRGAHAVLAGRPPTPSAPGTRGVGDLHVVRARDPETAQAKLLEVLRRIPVAYGLDPRRDVQVLTPMRKGPLGTETLNELLQAELNPVHSGPALPGVPRAGDKVMQLRNDYDREVFNGDIGWVTKVENGVTYVEIDERIVSYPQDEIDAIGLAYASTVHKAQGSEMPAVVLVLHPSHHVLLRRALLYTALTRARKLAVVVGDPRALALAAERAESAHTHSRLTERLRQSIGRSDR